jgi:hypothetical protein
MVFEKYAYEELFRYFQFRRPDKNDGLADDETIISATVICKDSTGTDKSSEMISDISVVEDTKVKYKIKAGSEGEAYIVYIKGVTSKGQAPQGHSDIKILAE